jgi:hypothetical protein
MNNPQGNPLPPITEREFQIQIIRYAQLLGYKVAHFRVARTSSGWRVPIEADGTGWPDLVMVRDKKILVAELKVQNRPLTRQQAAWLQALEGAGVAAYHWTPNDWREIQEVLSCQKLSG